MSRKGEIVPVSTWDHLAVYLLSFAFGVWILIKRIAQYVWNPNRFFHVKTRDTPPIWLVDTTLGQHKYVKLKRVKIHYVEAGIRGNPDLVLVHGFPDCWISWRYQIPFLSEYFRVIAVDLKGFGDSDKPIWRGSYKIDVILEELKQFLSAVGVHSCVIIGHDLGGLLGWFLMYDSPELVEKFVSVSCPHPNVYWDNLPMNGAVNGQWIKFAHLPCLPEIDAMREDLKIINEYHVHLQEKDNSEALEAYKYAFARKEDWSGPINYFRNLPFVRIHEKADQVKTSTLLVTGNKDQHVNLEGIVKSTDYCEKFFVKIIESAGHFPHQENPESFNKILVNFLKLKPKSSKNVKGDFNRNQSRGLMNRMFEYGNSMLDSVNKKTNGVIPISSFGMNFAQSNDRA